jgi:hypothetical protein
MKRSIVFLFLAGYSWISMAQSLYPFKRNELWGYLDSTGKEVIAPAYPMAGFFYDGLAYVQIGDALGYIDVTEKRLLSRNTLQHITLTKGMLVLWKKKIGG